MCVRFVLLYIVWAVLSQSKCVCNTSHFPLLKSGWRNPEWASGESALDRHQNQNQNCFYCQVSLRLPGICFGILVRTINIKNIISTTEHNKNNI